MLLLLAMAACHKEEKLVPDASPIAYTLPQGNHPYDDSIVAFHEKYGSYILYKFSYMDYAYDYTGYLTITAAQANEAYVQQALDFFNSQCLRLYPEQFLQKTMPFKIILAASIDTTQITNTGAVVVAKRSVSGFMQSRSMMAIGWADSTLQQQSASQLKVLKGYMNRCYFFQAFLSGALPIPDVFNAFVPVGGYNIISGYRPDLGFIEAPNSNDVSRNASVTWDLLCYINAITGRTKAELDATILSPSVDTKGLIRKKYALLINYFKTQYGVDLQAVGDSQ